MILRLVCNVFFWFVCFGWFRILGFRLGSERYRNFGIRVCLFCDVIYCEIFLEIFFKMDEWGNKFMIMMEGLEVFRI